MKNIINKFEINNQEVLFDNSKLTELELEVEEVNDKIKIMSDNDDLSFSDELGNKIVSFSNGHLKTNNFNSEATATHSYVKNAIEEGKDVFLKETLSADLSLDDEKENVIAQFVGGNIITKKFNSADYNISKTDIDLSSAGWIEYEIISGHRYYIYCTKGYKTRVGTTLGLTTSVIERVSYDGDKTNESGIEYDAGMSGIFKATQDATHLRFGNYFNGYIIDLDYSHFSSLLDSSLLIDVSHVELKTDYNTKDYSEEISNWDVSAVRGEDGFTGRQKLMEQVYSKLDELAENYPSYLSKEDAYSLVGVEYPIYAKLNGVGSGVFKATPTYKTWLYKLSYDNKDLGNVYVGGLNKKVKILLIGGTHGEERMQMLNIYYLVKSMLEISDIELWKLFSAFDFYIIPCLCGYGCYHSLRTNFDWGDNKGGVNINRNFPYNGWSVKDIGTYDYSGDSAGSESETKLIMKLIEYIKPEIVLDLHNYGSSQNYQFYFACNDANGQRLAYQSLVDLSLIVKRDLPQYFGIAPTIINGNISRSATSGSLAHYASFCKGVLFSATIEVSESINYINGEYNTGLPIDEYGADTMKVAEYTLRNMLIRISRYVLNKLNKLNK